MSRAIKRNTLPAGLNGWRHKEIMKKPEQIEKGDKSQNYRKFLKMIATRRMRILSKKLGQDAPKKNEYYGWSV